MKSLVPPQVICVSCIKTTEVFILVYTRRCPWDLDLIRFSTFSGIRIGHQVAFTNIIYIFSHIFMSMSPNKMLIDQEIVSIRPRWLRWPVISNDLKT